MGFSCHGAQALEHTGFVVAVLELSCPSACGILAHRPEIKPMSPALEGRLLTVGPPGKSLPIYLFGICPLILLPGVGTTCMLTSLLLPCIQCFTTVDITLALF